MIVSASRRTDIPAFYSEWFFNRIKEGYVLVRNPLNHHQVSNIDLSPSVVDCIVFWTKNPIKIINRLSELSKYSYYFQYTITPYDNHVEPNLPPKDKLIELFITLSNILGKSSVIWRYDPILLTNKYSIDFHIRSFDEMVQRLYPYTQKCVISFLDIYQKNKARVLENGICSISNNQMQVLASEFSTIAKQYGISLVSCAEEINLEKYGIRHGKCIDDKLISEILGYNLDIKKDPNQRKECGCIASVDIGSYNSCPHGCLYCYANYDQEMVNNNYLLHNPKSPILFGELSQNDNISNRRMVSCKAIQKKLFE